MPNKYNKSLSEIGIKGSISDFIDKTQIYHRPSSNFWYRKDDVLSDVSSESNVKSVISNYSDSISSMTSSESDDSVVSITQSGGMKAASSTPFTDFKTTYITPSSDDMVDFDGYIDSLNELNKHLSIIYKHMMAQSTFNIESILKNALDGFVKLHKTVCLLSSFDYVSRKLENTNASTLNRMLMAFKECYGGLVLFNTHLCKLLSKKVSTNIVSMIMDLMPYVIDTLFCTLLFLLYRLNHKETNNDLMIIFEKILSYCIILCYSYLDHTEEFLNKMAVLTLYRLTIVFVPLDLVYAIKTEAQDSKNNTEHNYRNLLVDLLKDEYLQDEFKPSSVVLFKLRSEIVSSGESEYETKLIKKCVSILETCLRTGVARRQYPTAQIDNVGCFDKLSTGSGSKQLSSLSFWLLQRLENLNSFVRRVALLIIRHALCTINFIERDRQYVLSYVYNCLSDDDTVPESLSVILCFSNLYPLKDGAVKKIANLTLKGSRSDIRLKVLDRLSRCRFTNKGLVFMLSVLKSLTKCSNNTNGRINGRNGGVDPANVPKMNEFKFSVNEWPAIVDALVSISTINASVIDKKEWVSDDFVPYIKKRKLNPIPPAGWISLLWNYLIDPEDEKSKIFKSLWFTEAMIRFPRLVKSLLDSNRKLVNSHLSNYNEFVSLGDPTNESKHGLVKHKKYWKSLHDFRIPFSVDHLEKVAMCFDDRYTVLESGKKDSNKKRKEDDHSTGCSCIDCKMDVIINDYHKLLGTSNVNTNFPAIIASYFEKINSRFDSIKDVLDPNSCEKTTATTEHTKDFEILTNNKRMEHAKMTSFLDSLLNCTSCPLEFQQSFSNTDDINCFEYPSSLGTDVSLNFSCRSVKYPSNLFVCYKLPSIVNASPHHTHTQSYPNIDVSSNPTDGDFCPHNYTKRGNKSIVFLKPNITPDHKTNSLYHGSIKFRLNFQIPLVEPIKIEFYYTFDGFSGFLDIIWIHPKCKF